MEHHKTFLPSLVSKVRSQCKFDDEGRVRKTEAKEVDEEEREREEKKRAMDLYLYGEQHATPSRH
jgi:hypothetical protein